MQITKVFLNYQKKRKIKIISAVSLIITVMENKNQTPAPNNQKDLGNTVAERVVLICTGIITGVVNGLFGGGGGMIVVPMLTFLSKLPSKNAHATALIIILPVCIVSGIFYAVFGNFRLDVGLPVTIGVVAGGIVGAFLLKKLPPKWVTLIFAVVMLAAGVKMLFF